VFLACLAGYAVIMRAMIQMPRTSRVYSFPASVREGNRLWQPGITRGFVLVGDVAPDHEPWERDPSALPVGKLKGMKGSGFV
jgi:hypothetical protein